MSHFKRDYLDFFRNLEKDNSKTWFEANRTRFETAVKGPFTTFVGKVIELIRKEDSEIVITPMDAIFRLNRDVRFSKDKSPYKTQMAANISRYGRRNTEYPGFYFQFGADKAMLGGGAYTLEKENLYKVRKAIIGNPAEFQSLVTNKEFRKKFGELKGEKNKTLPPEFKDAAVEQPLIANKQFYFMAELNADIILRRDLADFLMGYYRVGRPINEFLKRSMK